MLSKSKKPTPRKVSKPVELSDKQQVLQIAENATLHKRKDKTEFVITIEKKTIATGDTESACWKRALRSLL